ncbi:putative disease resistance protein At3g14460 [Trifolium pratense]|nr:putative disease resistance protein At3g14460 [Trifolium pratense]
MADTAVSRSNSVKVLLDALVSAKVVDNIKSTKLDVSLFKKLKTTLLKLQVILTYAKDKRITTNNLTVGLWLEILRTNAVITQIYDLFDEINIEALRCKVEAPDYRFNRMINYKLQRLIERLEFYYELQRSIERIIVSNSSSYWIEILTTTSFDLVDDSSIHIQLLPLSTSVKVLLDRLVSSLFVDFFRSKIVDDSSFLDKLKIRLARLQDVLNYAMRRHFTDPTVMVLMEWFGMLQYDVFEVETLFDEINTEALRRYKGKITPTTSQVLINLSSPFKRWVINSKMQKLIESLECLSPGGQKGELDVSIVIIQNLSLSTSVNALLDRLDSVEFIDNFRSTKLDVSLLEKLRRTLLVLHRAGEEQEHIFIVGHWLDILRNVVFEVGYFLDEINPEALHCEVEGKLKHLSSPSNSKFQKLIERLEFLSSRAQGQFGGSSSRSFWNESPRNSVLDDESSIYGRDTDIKKLKHLLLSSDDDDIKIGIISIVGIEGIGKTTLAKLLYNDPEVYDKFELKFWAHVSKHLDESIVLETLLDDRYRERDDTSGVNNRYPKFLLVLDEVRDTGSINWTLLMNICNVGETGSRIIITTQDEGVALSVQTFAPSIQTFLSIHYLRPLESEDCWSLLARHAFGACNDQQQFNLEGIGREIANKCFGSPFAAVALGDILRIKLSPDYWNVVLESDIWVLTDHDVQPFIQLSYHYLSTSLKRCFAYCSIFPKKSIIEKKIVVQLWIAEGLVESSTNLEKVGEEYFDVLVSRSLIQRSIGDEGENYEMHNLVHDFATEVSSSYCINMDEHNLHDRVHNLSYNRGIFDSYTKFDKLYGLEGLRTFLALPLQEKLPLCLLSNKVVHDLLPTMKQLRALSLSNYKSITELPNSIGDLLYLQYLNLSHTEIEKLPTETCKLYNLQFLLLAGCKRLIELPDDIGKLVNLRHLDVSDTALREMPVQIAKLENLQTLSNFVVSKHNHGLKLAELENFPRLHGKLSISQLQNVNDLFEADEANMKMKDQIDELALEWDCGSNVSNSQTQSVVLEHLRPSTKLKSLTIKGYGGINFPKWLGDSLFSNMVYLRISNCDDCLWLPPLGQLGNLKELIIEGMQSMETISIDFYGSDSSSFQPFPSLETLHFEDMQGWEEWDWIGGTTIEFPSLKTLSLSKCPQLGLGNIADKFPSLTRLELRECPLLVQSMPSLDHAFSEMMFPFHSLRQLTIDGFPSLTSFPTDGLPETLKFLIISNCENLEFLPHELLHNYTSLEELKISYSCNSMISFTLGALPVLKSLFIEGCKNLKSILIAEGASEKSLSFLRSIKIWDCNELESFPPGGLATPNLVYIAVWKCEKLRSLPEAMNTLTALQEMEIDNLLNLQSFVIADLPISLRELTVGSVGGILRNTEPTWIHLKCLSVLRIKGGDMVKTFVVPFLPTFLVTLCICGLDDKNIDWKWLRHLTSLQNLEIVNAPKLKLLPKKGLSSSLLVLSMTHCPLLKASLRRKQGKEWRKIAHIPSIIIDGELIT